MLAVLSIFVSGGCLGSRHLLLDILDKSLSSRRQGRSGSRRFELRTPVVVLLLDRRCYHRRAGTLLSDLETGHVRDEAEAQKVAFDDRRLLDAILVVDFDELLAVGLHARVPWQVHAWQTQFLSAC